MTYTTVNDARKLILFLRQVVAEACPLKFVLRLHQALEPWEIRAIETLLQLLYKAKSSGCNCVAFDDRELVL